MEKENPISTTQSLEIISEMIYKARNQFSENGHLYLVWGWVVFICALAQYLLLNVFNYERHYLVWTVTFVVVLYQIIYLARNKRSTTVKTYTHDIIGYVWLVFVILMFLQGIIFGFILGGTYYKAMNPGLLALYGMPTFLSGIILRFRPLIIGGISCWVLAIASAFVTVQYHTVFLAAAVLIAWIIPGYLVRRRHINIKHSDYPTKLA